MLPFIPILIGAIGKIGTSWLETRKVKAAGKIRIAEAKIEGKIAREQAILNMDMSAMNGMRWSWKDEYLLVLLSIPVIMAFVPGLEGYALRGFGIVDQMPDWYKWAMTGMIAATFGLRSWKGFFTK
jgi:hypothetical protein